MKDILKDIRAWFMRQLCWWGASKEYRKYWREQNKFLKELLEQSKRKPMAKQGWYENGFDEGRIQERQRIKERLKILKEDIYRVRLDVNVIVCDCGEKYKDSDLDLSVGYVEKALKELLNQFK